MAFAREDHDAVLAGLAERVSPRVLRAPARLDAAARQLEEYFAGRRRHFELPVDLQLARGFRRAVLEFLPEVSYGSTVSYAALAAATGSPRAVRAVGTACATNPVPIVVPCHRVVRSDGTPGQYGGGSAAKLTLLALEAQPEPVPNGRVEPGGRLWSASGARWRSHPLQRPDSPVVRPWVGESCGRPQDASRPSRCRP